MCSSVDLPEPEGPTMATNSPFSTLKLTSSMALICVSPFPYTFERLFTLRISTACLQDFYDIHSIRTASDATVTAIVTIYSQSGRSSRPLVAQTALGVSGKGDSHKSET